MYIISLFTCRPPPVVIVAAVAAIAASIDSSITFVLYLLDIQLETFPHFFAGTRS